jgi:hypothetical protein
MMTFTQQSRAKQFFLTEHSIFAASNDDQSTGLYLFDDRCCSSDDFSFFSSSQFPIVKALFHLTSNILARLKATHLLALPMENRVMARLKE